MKVNPQYFWPGKHHLCMFCDVPIGKLLESGGIKPTSNKAHVLLQKTEPGLFIINCCADCAKRVNFKDEEVLKAIRFNVVRSWEFLDSLKGIDSTDSHSRRKRLSDVPRKSGFNAIECNIKDRTNNIKQYKELTNGR